MLKQILGHTRHRGRHLGQQGPDAVLHCRVLLSGTSSTRGCENHYHSDSKSLKFALTLASSYLPRNR